MPCWNRGVQYFCYVLILQNIALALSERTRDKIYMPIAGASCFRRLNGTHQTGCSSSYSGSVGAVHLVQDGNDIDFLIGNPPAPPYAPMIPPHLFTRHNLLRLKQAGAKNISAVLLINRTDKMSNFSHELNCPNQYSGILVPLPNKTEMTTCDAQNVPSSWNPWGSGLLHEDFPFPIYYIADVDEIDKLVDCFMKFNNFNYERHALRSLCAVEVNTFMSAAVSAEVCMRRTNFLNNLGRTKYCDPLEGRNIYASLFPRQATGSNEPDVKEKFILVTTRLDTTSMFDGVGLGAMDSLFGYATLVHVAHMLAQLLPKSARSGRNVLFVIFNGESYDYIGSQRFVYDLEHLAFPTRSTLTAPITFENIEFMVDIGALDEISFIKAHTLNEFTHSTAFVEKLQKYANSSKFDFHMNFESAVGMQLPPTSAQSFLRKNLSFPALILNAVPKNRYYHSIYDDLESMNFTYANTTLNYNDLMEASEASQYFAANSVQMKVRNVSSVIALALFETLQGVAYTGTKLANPLLADEFLYCFLQSADCPLFKAASHPNSLPGLPIPPLRYISVSGGSQESSGWTYRLLGYLLSQHVTNKTKDTCVNLPEHWFAGYGGQGECRLTTQNYSHALSPAFLLDDYDWKSGQYSTWTESTWIQLSARMFLRPSKTHEIVTLSIGIVMLVLSFCLVYIISVRSEVLFEDAPTSTAALTEPTAC